MEFFKRVVNKTAPWFPKHRLNLLGPTDCVKNMEGCGNQSFIRLPRIVNLGVDVSSTNFLTKSHKARIP
jgi:hypothetical protein